MKITIGDYLLLRLKELGIKHIFGVPGDYNLVFLDKIIEHPEIEWIGTCNELNGAYATDGYARINGAGALVTTFGVGELSAINGIAGSYAEYVPIVHIVGIPSTSIIENKSIVHHTLGDQRFNVFMEMYKGVTITHTILNKDNAADEIDKALTACWQKKRPVYLGIPSDIVDEKIQVTLKRLNLKYPSSNLDAVHECAERISRLITKAQSPVILADLCADRHPMKKLIEKFLSVTKIPFANMNMGKGLIDESHAQYIGNYCGEFSSGGVQEKIETSDCVVTFGSLLSDLNTGGFSANLDTNTTAEIHTFFTQIKHSKYKDVMFCDLIPLLTKKLASYRYPLAIRKPKDIPLTPKSKRLTHAYFWKRISNCLAKNSVILAEAGTCLFGALQMQLPDGAKFISQTLWGSIGYTLGALLGVKIADPQRHTILFIGDGSFQLTAQEISTMMRQQLNPIIFVLNNDGYTIERLIHGPKMPYNDVAQWDYQKFPKSFHGKVYTTKVKNQLELEKVIKQINSGQMNKNRLALIEVMLSKLDAPQTLIDIGKAMNKRNLGDGA